MNKKNIKLAQERKYHFRKKFGIEYSDVVQMWKDRDKCCEICGRKTVLSGWKYNSACLDHDHKTGKMRGLICAGCNHAIGLIRDNPQTAIAIHLYLKNYKETQK